MTRRFVFIILALGLSVPAFAQPSQVHVVEMAAHEGYLAKCQQDESPEAKKGCALFTRLVAFRLQHLGWGLLTKAPGENNYEGFAVDAIVHRDTLAVIDIISSSETPGARAGWIGPQPRRPHNVYAQPFPLTAAEMAFLGGRSPEPNPGTPVPNPGTPPIDLAPILARLDALEARINGVAADAKDVRAVLAAESQNIRAILAALPTPEPLPIYKGSLWGIRILSRPCPGCK